MSKSRSITVEGKPVARKEKLIVLLESDPSDPFLHYALAKEFLSEGDTDEGLRRLEEMNREFPTYHAAHFERGRALVELDRTAEAREVIVVGIEAARTEGDSHAVNEMTGFLEMI